MYERENKQKIYKRVVHYGPKESTWRDFQCAQSLAAISAALEEAA